MSCADIRKHLPALVLGDLEGPGLDATVAHLKGCEGCRAERAHLEGTLGALKKLPAPEPRASRRERVVAAMVASVPEAAPEKKTRRPGFGGFAAAAGVLLAVAATWMGATGRLSWMTAKPQFALKAEDVKGEVLVQRAGGTQWEPLQAGAEVRLGDRVNTNNGGRAWFRSSARDLVVMAPATQVMVNRADPDNPSVMLVYGKLWAEITPRESGKHLRFETPEGEGFVEVLGTRLQVEYR